jgi:photosystem II stability/assembly factor-like uncharacterized protein
METVMERILPCVPHLPVSSVAKRLPARVATGPTRSFAILFVVLAFSLAAFAQEDAPPEQAVIAPLAERSLLLDAAAADGNIVVVGERGHILVSGDAGATWKQVPVPTRATLTGVWFEGRDLGWAVGHDSVILRTRDGGSSWERVYWAPEDESPFLDVWFSDADNGFAIGAYGSFYVTADGGETWDFVPVAEDDFQPHLNHIAHAADGTLYLAAEAGTVFRSDDGGETWVALESPYEGSFFGSLPLDDGAVLIFGLRGHLFRSEDRGETWEQIETDTTGMLNQGIRLDDGRIVIVGLSGAVLVSTDDGRTFELRPQQSRAGIQAVIEAGEDHLVFVGEFGTRRVPLSELFGG